MKVRVKEGKNGFIYGVLRHGDIEERKPDEFTLEAFDHPRKEGPDGKPLRVTEEMQFSKVWMELIDKPKAKPGPKPKSVE